MEYIKTKLKINLMISFGDIGGKRKPSRLTPVSPTLSTRKKRCWFKSSPLVVENSSLFKYRSGCVNNVRYNHHL
jgi:hypothetical protein